MTMQAIATNPLEAYQWERQPQAEALVRELVAEFLGRNTFAAELARRMKDETGTRFYDWVDYIALPAADARVARLKAAGYEQVASDANRSVYTNSGGMFPAIIVRSAGNEIEVGIKVEFAADFAAAHGIQNAIVGEPLSMYRSLVVSEEKGARLAVVERHGCRFRPAAFDAKTAVAMLRHFEAFRSRRRDFGDDDAAGFEHANNLIDKAIADLGADLTCDIWFAAEREYWQRRNRAAQVQKARQDKLGLGWGNHDHHTYRCARENFRLLVATWEKLGFHCRERFYAGREAGWGAQVMEQPNAGIITFNDVDLTPDELMGDFSHDGLQPREKFGTVGLWCALHGDSFLQSGMHHLEAQFDFDSLRDQLEKEDGVKMMKPFTNFTFLRQAFTEGERWKVAESRLQRALSNGYITQEQAKQFREQGAIGSHLENLERNEGFKGFNQTGVSEIISATDPRKQVRQ